MGTPRLEVAHDGLVTRGLIRSTDDIDHIEPGPVAGTATMEWRGARGVAVVDSGGWWRSVGLWTGPEHVTVAALSSPKRLAVKPDVKATARELQHTIEHEAVRGSLLERGEALRASWNALRAGCRSYRAFTLALAAEPDEEALVGELRAALKKPDAQTPRAVALLAAVAAARGVRFGPAVEDELLKHAVPRGGGLRFQDLRFIERYLGSLPDERRAERLPTLGLSRFSHAIVGPATAKAAVEKVATYPDKALKLWDLRPALAAMARENGPAVLEAAGSAPKKHAALMLEALAWSGDAEVLAHFVGQLGKGATESEARRAMRFNPALRAALDAHRSTKKSKSQRAAHALCALWEGRDPAVAEAEARLRSLADDYDEAKRAQLLDALSAGAATDGAALLDLASEHGDAAWAVLHGWLVGVRSAEGVSTQEAPMVGASLEAFLRTLASDDAEATAERLAVAGTQDLAHIGGQGARMSVYLADEMRFRDITFASRLQESALRDAHLVPVMLEALRHSAKKQLDLASSRLADHPDETRAALPPYLARPDTALHAAKLAERLPAAQLIAPLEAVLADKPAKKLAAQVEAALVACRAAAAAAGVEEPTTSDATTSDATTSDATTSDASTSDATTSEAGPEPSPAEPSRSNPLSDALRAHAKGRKKLPDWRATLAWSDGATLSVEERKGLLQMLLAVQDASQSESLARFSETLADPTAIAAEALRVQPLSGKQKEVWSLYVVGVFGDDAQVEALRTAAVTGHHSLAAHAVGALQRRARGRDIRALYRAIGAGGKKRQLAEQALGAILGDAWSRCPARARYELFDRSFVGDSGEDARRQLRAFMEASMILGRPMAPSHVRALLDDAFIRGALAGAVLVQGARLFLVGADGVEGCGHREALADGDLSLVHPVKLDDADRSAAAAALKERGLEAPFPQLARPFRAVTRAELSASAKGMDLGDFQARGYVPGEFLPDANAVVSCVKRIAPGAAIEVMVDGALHDHRGVLDVHVDTPFRGDEGLLSEAALDLEAMTVPRSPGGNTPPRGREPRADAPTGGSTEMPRGFPSAELAPSGRAKCLVSGDKIPKGAVRIVVPREVDTPAFQGITKGYVLPQHARAWVDEAGHDWDSFARAVREAAPGLDLSALDD